MSRPLGEQIVVLTGASSGIGRATALELARRLGDPQALAAALFGFTVPGSPIGWDEEKLEAARQAKDMPRTGMFPFQVAQMLWSLADVLGDGGDIDGAKQIWNELDTYAERVEDPYVRSWQAFTVATRSRAAGERSAIHSPPSAAKTFCGAK